MREITVENPGAVAAATGARSQSIGKRQHANNITAFDIAHGLNAVPTSSHSWHARCPVLSHNDPGLSLRLGFGAKGPLVYCTGGCSQRQVIIALRSCGLWGQASPRVVAARQQWIERAQSWIEQIRRDLNQREKARELGKA